MHAALEFICAQSPYNMRGMLIGVYYSFRGLFNLLGGCVLLIVTFSYQNSPDLENPPCGGIYYSLITVCAIIGLVVYVCISRKYRRRQRDDRSLLEQYNFVEQYYGSLD